MTLKRIVLTRTSSANAPGAVACAAGRGRMASRDDIPDAVALRISRCDIEAHCANLQESHGVSMSPKAASCGKRGSEWQISSKPWTCHFK